MKSNVDFNNQQEKNVKSVPVDDGIFLIIFENIICIEWKLMSL